MALALAMTVSLAVARAMLPQLENSPQ